jgi:hypothetical protein
VLKGLLQNFPSNDNALNLRSTFTNRAELRVAPVFFSRVVFRVTVATMYLNGVLANLDANFRCETVWPLTILW